MSIRLLLFFVFNFILIAGFAQSSTWFTNVNLINTSEGKVRPGATVVVEGNRITNVFYQKKVKTPDTVRVVALQGKYMMPGLIDAHIHFFQSGGLYTRPDALNLSKFHAYEKDQQWIGENLDDLMRRYLACGITSVIDVGGPLRNFQTRTNCNNNELSPNAYVTGPLISTYQPPNLDKGDPPIIKADNEEAARELVRKQLPYQPDFIKIWYIVLPGQSAEKTLPIIRAAIDESHKNKIKIAVHATEYHTARLAVEAGCDILVHSVSDRLMDEAFLALLKAKNIVYIPTLIVASKYKEVFTQQQRLNMHDFRFANPFALGSLFDLQHLNPKEAGIDYLKIRKALKIPSKEDTINQANLQLANDAGVHIVSGTDAGNIGTQHGSSFLDELKAMRAAGMTNAGILKASTITSARGFGKENEVGSIEKGKLANLLILDKNPLDSLEFLEQLVYVVNRGKLIKTDTLLPATPEILAQQQLNAYNARNMDAFLAPYSDSVAIYNFNGQLLMKGKDQMRKGYEGMFQKVTNLHCQLVNRIVQGNVVIDQESVTGFGPQPLKAIAIYTVEKGKIQQVHFIQ
jgi:imidazolonepropionase-like amidohydrolase